MNNVDKRIEEYMSTHRELKIVDTYSDNNYTYVLFDDNSSSDFTESGTIVRINDDVLEDNTPIGAVIDWKLNLNSFRRNADAISS